MKETSSERKPTNTACGMSQTSKGITFSCLQTMRSSANVRPAINLRPNCSRKGAHFSPLLYVHDKRNYEKTRNGAIKMQLKLDSCIVLSLIKSIAMSLIFMSFAQFFKPVQRGIHQAKIEWRFSFQLCSVKPFMKLVHWMGLQAWWSSLDLKLHDSIDIETYRQR